MAIERLVAAAAATGAPRARRPPLRRRRAADDPAPPAADGVRLSVETCPHYLSLDADEVADGHTEFKCCPPIRDAANRDLLWDALADGAIDLVVSDHSPCTPELKRLDTGDFGDAWGGIASAAARAPRGVDRGAAPRPRRWPTSSAGCARARPTWSGCAARAGSPSAHDADLCVLAPDESFTVDPATLHHRNPVTAYAGRTLTGTVRQTWLRGVPRRPRRRRPAGRLLRRGEA